MVGKNQATRIQIALFQELVFIMARYTWHLLYKEILIFPTSYTSEMKLFPTS